MVNPQRDVPRSIIRAGLTAVVAYAAFLITILLVLPRSQLSNVGSFLTAFKSVDSVLGSFATPLGWAVALAFAIALASSGGTWIMGADRTYAISALDRTAPLVFGRFSGRFGTPIAVNLMSGIMATIAMVAAILVNTFGGKGNITTLFGFVLGFVVSTATIAYLFIFPSFLILRYKYPRVPRVYRVPGGMVGAWIVTVLAFGYALIAVVFILVPGTTSIDRLTYELTQFIPLAIIVLLTIIFYIMGHNDTRNQDVFVELHTDESDIGRAEGIAGE